MGAPHHHRVTTELRGAAAHVSFDRAQRGNSFTGRALSDLVAALEQVSADPAVTVVQLTMAGDNFCTGWDTAEFAALAAAPRDAVEQSLRDNDQLLGRIRDLPVPVVAGVRGHVAGFGMGLLASVSLPVLAGDTTAALPEVGHGICPGGVLHGLLNRLPRTAVHLLAVSGGSVSATELLAWGLAARVVPATALASAVAALVDQIASHRGPVVRLIVATERRAGESAAPAYRAAAESINALARNDP